jgi:hypothetical protein
VGQLPNQLPKATNQKPRTKIQSPYINYQSHEPKATHQNSESIYQLPKATHQLSYRYRALLGSISKGHKSQRGESNPTFKFGTPGAPRWNHPTASPLTRPHMRSLMCGPGHTTGRTPSGRHIPGVERVR